MGAIIYETGGLLIDFGWLRILGSGHPRLPRTLPGWNLGRTIDVAGRTLAFLLIADDVLGGFFAINGGGLGEGHRNVFYFAPDSLAWEDMELGYSDFIQWCLSGDVAQFYGGYRWEGWEAKCDRWPATGDILFIRRYGRSVHRSASDIGERYRWQSCTDCISERMLNHSSKLMRTIIVIDYDPV
jgi:hypothetical protein